MDLIALVGIAGTIGTFAFGGVAVWQIVQERIRRAARDAHAGHLNATVEQLGIIRAQFTEALANDEVFKTEADKAVIRATAYNLLAAENHIRTALGGRQEEPRPLPAARRNPNPTPAQLTE